MRFVWFSTYLLLGLIAAYPVLLLFALMGSMTAAGLGAYVSVGIVLAALLCVVSQLALAFRRKRKAR